MIVTKSTVPVGTGAWLATEVARQRLGPVEIDVVSNPEFLREGSAVSDFLRPDRVVIGTSSERAAAIMREIYRPLYLIETPIVMTDVETAEMIKYASNAFLAVKIGFMNEIANLCDRVGADVHVVAKGMGLDKRIGSKFLHPGPGYGGSCFPKDTRALAALGAARGAPQRIVEAAIDVNARQRQIIVEKIDAGARWRCRPAHRGAGAGVQAEYRRRPRVAGALRVPGARARRRERPGVRSGGLRAGGRRRCATSGRPSRFPPNAYDAARRQPTRS